MQVQFSTLLNWMSDKKHRHLKVYGYKNVELEAEKSLWRLFAVVVAALMTFELEEFNLNSQLLASVTNFISLHCG